MTPRAKRKFVRNRQGRARVSDTHGEDTQKTLLPLDRAILDNHRGGTLAWEVLPQKVNGFWLKPYAGATPPNPFKNTTDPTLPKAGPLRVESSLEEEPTT